MMSKSEFEQWCQENRLTPEAIKLISHIRSAEPSRSVESKRNNVSGKYASRKMRCTIQFESHTVELPRIYELEYDKEVLEYYDQPGPIKLVYYRERKLGVMHTPDFFVIKKAEAGWEECKTEKDLLKLAEKAPERFGVDDQGEWRCPPGEEYARLFGLYYRLYSSKKINWTFHRNFELLQDYYDNEK